MLDKETLSAVRKVIGDMRFMQAAAVVASGLSENKQSIAYMNSLAKLDRTLEQEILKGGAV